MRITKGIKLVLLLSAFCLPIAACGDEGPLEEIDQVKDCLEICDRYQECVDSSVDLTACADACEDLAEVEQETRIELDRCEDCLDDRSCQEIEDAACFDNCPIVPLQD